MGFRFRRTLRIMPGVRLNVSRSGPSVSFGARGAHYTVGPKGTRATVGVPGTGLSWTAYNSYGSRWPPQPGQPHPQNNPGSGPQDKPNSTSPTGSRNDRFRQSTIEEMASSSTSKLAPILDAARKQWRYHPFVLGFTAAALCLAVVSHSQPAIAGIVVFGVIAWPAMFLIDRHRLTIILFMICKVTRTKDSTRYPNI